MHNAVRAIVAVIVLGSGLARRGTDAGARPAHAAALRDRIFAGLQTGYIYASADGGQSWQESDAGLPSGAGVRSLAVVPDGHTLYAGTDAGVYLSTDDGQSWQNDNGGDPVLSGDQVRSVLVSPSRGSGNVQVVYAATRGGSVGRSSDGGRHWQVNPLPGGRSLITLAIDSGQPSTLLAITYGAGLLISRDAGASWNDSSPGIPPTLVAESVDVSPTQVGMIYVGTSDGVYRTIDSGATWDRTSRGIPGGTTISAIAVDPLHGTHILAGDGFGHVYRSLDGGSSWTQAQTPFQVGASGINALLYDPARPGSVLAALTAAISIGISGDQGATWSESSDGVFSHSSALCLAISLRPGTRLRVSPTDPVDTPAAGLARVQYFAQTGHTVRGVFYDFYHRYGDLAIFGLPLTEAYTDHGQVVQYFERAELALTAGGVRESPLGSLLTAGRIFAVADPPPLTESYVYFGATGRWIAGRFLDFWQRHHGQLLFGDPISEPLAEQNDDGTGRTYRVQYFQNARLEYHPELAGTDNEVQIGLTGRQYLRKVGLL